MPDFEEPVVIISYPANNDVLNEIVEIGFSVSDNSNLIKAELWINNESNDIWINSTETIGGKSIGCLSIKGRLRIVNKIIVDFQNGKKKTSFEKLKEFVNTNSEDETARYNFYTDENAQEYVKKVKPFYQSQESYMLKSLDFLW